MKKPGIKDTMQISKKPIHKKTGWGIAFYIVGLLQVSILGLYFVLFTLVWADFENSSKALNLLYDFVNLLGSPALTYPSVIIVGFNLIGLPIYLFKRRPRIISVVLGILSFLVSLFILDILL